MRSPPLTVPFVIILPVSSNYFADYSQNNLRLVLERI